MNASSPIPTGQVIASPLLQPRATAMSTNAPLYAASHSCLSRSYPASHSSPSRLAKAAKRSVQSFIAILNRNWSLGRTQRRRKAVALPHTIRTHPTPAIDAALHPTPGMGPPAGLAHNRPGYIGIELNVGYHRALLRPPYGRSFRL